MTAPAGFSNGVMCANNVCFNGTRTAQMTATDQIIVGKTGSPPEVLTLTAGAGVTITHGSGTLILAAGATVPTQFNEDVGSATPAANILRINGGANISTSGAANVVTVACSLIGYTDAAADYNVALGHLCNTGKTGDRNIVIGYNSLANPLFTGGSNTFIGHTIANSATTASGNICLSANFAMRSLLTGNKNIGIGWIALDSLTSGSQNIAISSTYALANLTTGSSNVALGCDAAGFNYTGAESNNIVIGSKGFLGESNAIHIGAHSDAGLTDHAKCYIAGIDGVTPGVANAKVPIIDSNGQLGTLAAMTNGQLIIGSTGANPQLGQLQPGPGIAITSGAGTITVGAIGGGLSWTTKAANDNFVVNNGYIAIAPGGALVFTLPSISSVGAMIGITLDGATSFGIAQGATQTVRIGSVVTTGGAGTKVVSTAQGDTLLLLCTVAGTGAGDGAWNAISVVGNFTMT